MGLVIGAIFGVIFALGSSHYGLQTISTAEAYSTELIDGAVLGACGLVMGQWLAKFIANNYASAQPDAQRTSSSWSPSHGPYSGSSGSA